MKFKLKQTYTSPLGIIEAGAVKDELEWMQTFPGLDAGDCANKTDWFERALINKVSILAQTSKSKTSFSRAETKSAMTKWGDAVLNALQERMMEHNLFDTPTQQKITNVIYQLALELQQDTNDNGHENTRTDN